MLDSGAEGPGFKSGNSLRQTVHTHRASVHQPAKLVAALVRVAGPAESNGSLPPDRRTDGRTPYHYIGRVPYTMRAAAANAERKARPC